MRFDDEVFAVVMAIIVIGSVFGIAQTLRPAVTERFTALGLLNSECLIGDYPKTVVAGDNVTLCIFVFNYNGTPIYYRVQFKIGDKSTLPTNTTPSSMPVLKYWEGMIDHNQNTTFKVNVSVNEPGPKKAIIFELWYYIPANDTWVYSGRWTHLYVNVVEAPVP